MLIPFPWWTLFRKKRSKFTISDLSLLTLVCIYSHQTTDDWQYLQIEYYLLRLHLNSSPKNEQIFYQTRIPHQFYISFNNTNNYIRIISMYLLLYVFPEKCALSLPPIITKLSVIQINWWLVHDIIKESIHSNVAALH